MLYIEGCQNSQITTGNDITRIVIPCKYPAGSHQNGDRKVKKPSLGEEKKKTQPCELENLDVARKSLYAAKPIAAGERFSVENIEIKRPAGGMSPMRYWEILGSTAREEIPKGKPIR